MVKASRRPFRSAVGCAAIAAALTLNGCSLMNPHVTPEMERPSARMGEIDFAGGTATAIDYANSWRTAYYDAVGDQSKLRNGMALVAIPAAATALYFGISGNSTRDVIAGLATGTAGMLGVGMFLESSDREKVYLAGSQALGCVILASSPLLVPQREFDRFRRDLDGTLTDTEMTAPNAVELQQRLLEGSLVGKIAKTESALAKVDAVTTQMRAENMAQDPALLAAQPMISAGRTLVSTAAATAGTADAFVGRILSAEPTIIAQIDNVVAKVSMEIVKTEPNIASITQITGGLGSAAGRVATIPQPKPAEKPATAPKSANDAHAGADTRAAFLRGQLDQALDELEAATTELSSITARVRAFLAAQDDRAKLVGKVDACQLGDVGIGVTITPADSAVTLAPGQDYNVIISGGKRPYAAVLAGGHIPEGVTLTRSGFDQQPVVATISTDKDKTKAGTFAVAISDASDTAGVLINFTVTGAAAPSVQPPGTAGAGTTPPKSVVLTDYEKQLGKIRVRIAQSGLGLQGGSIDGEIGKDTRDRVTLKFPANTKGEIDEPLYNTLAKAVDEKWAADTSALLKCTVADSKNTYECSEIDTTKYAQIQIALGVTDGENDKFDEPTRTKIKAFQADPAKHPGLTIANPNDQLSDALVKHILH
jgi:hypothetical protein